MDTSRAEGWGPRPEGSCVQIARGRRSRVLLLLSCAAVAIGAGSLSSNAVAEPTGAEAIRDGGTSIDGVRRIAGDDLAVPIGPRPGPAAIRDATVAGEGRAGPSNVPPLDQGTFEIAAPAAAAT